MSTDVAVPDTHPALRNMVRVLMADASIAETSGEGTGAFVMDVMEKILQAGESGDFDAIFAAQESGMVSGKDFAGQPFLVQEANIDIRPSSQSNIDNGGFTHYAIMKVWDLSVGQEVTLNCGGKTFMATLYALRMGGYFTADKGCPPEGRAFQILAIPSGDNAYLKLVPFRMPEAPSASAKKSKA